LIIVDDIEQLGREWMQMRIGSIGGSSISKAVAQGKGKVKNQLMYDMIGELLSGEKKVGYTSAHMLDGIEFEDEARRFYSFVNDVEVKQVALIKASDHKHYSPDGLIDNDGIVEIKIAIPSVFAETKITHKIATDRRRQVQWGLFISEREWCDYVMYCPVIKLINPMLIIRVVRDENEIKELNRGADEFLSKMMRLFKELKNETV